jgi:hypothetical protein
MAPVCPDGHSRIRHARMGVLRGSIIQRCPSSRRPRDSGVIGNGGRTAEGCADDATRLSLGADWLDVPEPVAALLRQHLRNRSNMTTAANPASPWLFPGQLAGEHRSYRRLVHVLDQHGIPARRAGGPRGANSPGKHRPPSSPTRWASRRAQRCATRSLPAPTGPPTPPTDVLPPRRSCPETVNPVIGRGYRPGLRRLLNRGRPDERGDIPMLVSVGAGGTRKA